MKLVAASLIVVSLMSGAAFAQSNTGNSKNPVTDVLRTMLPGRQKNTVAAVEAMPADKFGYKPTPEQMTFGHLVSHMIEANNTLCAQVGDIAPPPSKPVPETAEKSRMVDALKTSFNYCSSALGRADDSKLSDMVEVFGEKRTRATAFIMLASGWADHYAAAAMYLRLNGILPPTAQKQKDK